MWEVAVLFGLIVKSLSRAMCQAGRVAEGSRSLPTSRGDVESGLQAVEDALEAVLEVLVHRLLGVLAGI
jgi:hypothetical protein